jgi:formylglycine-generating enzyme required for sulfatase activity
MRPGRRSRLSNVVRLEKARDEARALYPAWPETAEALRVWLDRDARALRDALPELRATVAVLKERALPRTEEEAEAERRAHPRAAELATMAGRLGMLERAKAVRSGAAKPPVFELRDTDLPSTARELNGLAWPLVDPGRKTYGREAEGLALARRAVARAVADGIPSSPMRDSLAWALFAVGLDEEAVAQSEAALAAAPENQRALFEKALVNLRNAVAWVSGPEGRANIAGLAAQVRKLREEVNARKTWRFADEADAFLHATLGEVIAGIEAFEREEAADVGRRLKWAERVEELTITRHAKQWEVARKAIRKADGKTASRLYAAVPLDLEPQIGLVPIGMNRRTGLWEFYHLRSAWDPDRHPDPADIEIAGFAADGRIDMEGRGVVFVLLPGGRFTMGAQRGDPAAPHYDPAAEDEEAPVTEVELAPFFLSRYEMTQGQWSRLTGGGAPSWYIVGNGYHGIPVPIADHHPVEQVDWGMCAELMRQQGLALPTEAQWEYGCRAGTSTPWSTGRVVESLHGFANVLDRTGQSVEPVWPGGEAFDDGFKGPAPVGNYAANAFGLHDMHGNVWEWCRDWFGLYSTPTRGGDGLREPAQHEDIRASRGGSYQQAAFMARSAFRAYRAPNARSPVVGFRAARRIDSRSR